MKKPSPFVFAILLATAAALPLAAQEPPLGLTPARPDSLLPESPGGLPLIPDALPPLEKAPRNKPAKKEKQSATAAADDALRDRIKLRVAKTKAQRAPELQILWDSHFQARTDYEQREILTRYYTLLTTRIAKIDPSIKREDIAALKAAYLSNFDQTRIAPTLPPDSARAR